MSTRAAFDKLALSFEETDKHPHMERTAYRVKGKIFATLHPTDGTANLRLKMEEQYVFTKADEHVFPVPGGWGRMGWTTVRYTKVAMPMLKELLLAAYIYRAPPKLAEKYLPDQQ